MLKSLNHIVISALENQPHWQGQQQWQQVLNSWVQVVGATAARQTRPHSLVRDILYVATSSSAWVQDLQFKRPVILQQLNAHLSSPLVDIRFSTAHWHQDNSAPPTTSLQAHPSHLGEAVSEFPSSHLSNSNTPQLAFQEWVEMIQVRSRMLPLCPQCHCPTPPGELKRWQVCGLCAAKQW